MIAIGLRLALVEPRISAAALLAESCVPRSMFHEARQVTIALLALLQWDDESHPAPRVSAASGRVVQQCLSSSVFTHRWR